MITCLLKVIISKILPACGKCFASFLRFKINYLHRDASSLLIVAVSTTFVSQLPDMRHSLSTERGLCCLVNRECDSKIGSSDVLNHQGWSPFFFFFASLSRQRFSSSTLVFPICGKNPTLLWNSDFILYPIRVAN